MEIKTIDSKSKKLVFVDIFLTPGYFFPFYSLTSSTITGCSIECKYVLTNILISNDFISTRKDEFCTSFQYNSTSKDCHLDFWPVIGYSEEYQENYEQTFLKTPGVQKWNNLKFLLIFQDAGVHKHGTEQILKVLISSKKESWFIVQLLDWLIFYCT